MSAHDAALRRIAQARETKAEWLDLGDLGLDRLPKELGDLPALRWLALGMYKIVEKDGQFEWKWAGVDRPEVIIADVTPLAALTQLRSLSLAGCTGLRDIGPLAKLTQLQSLYLIGCSDITRVGPLAALTQLRELSLAWCTGLTAADPLAALVQLEYLSLEHCTRLRDMTPLAALVRLRRLDLDSCKRFIFAPLRPLLRHLDHLRLYRSESELPAEIGRQNKDVLEAVKAHYANRGHAPATEAGPTGPPGPDRTASTRPPQPQLADPRSPPRQVYISYAWGDDQSPEGRRREELVDRLCVLLERDGYQVFRDKKSMRHGDQISEFMLAIGRGSRIVVVLSDKYLRSPYCMHELYLIYQRALGNKEEFLRRIVTGVLDDARIDGWKDRVYWHKHWKETHDEMYAERDHLGLADEAKRRLIEHWYREVGDMLAYIADTITPRGLDEIVADDFAVIRGMLECDGA